MSRLVIAFCILPLILCSVGCRMCSTPHDYRISTYVERPCDYRGFNPMYRAGSILTCWNGTHYAQQMFDEDIHGGEFVDYYSNAGNFGVTTPITTLRHTPATNGTFDAGSNAFEFQPDIIQRPSIAVPQRSPEEEGFSPSLRVRGSESTVPTIEELLDRQRSTTSVPLPIIPPGAPRTAPQGFEGIPIDNIPTIPFSPSDLLPNGNVPNGLLPRDDVITIPPSTFPTNSETEPPITLEELRRLDPTIQDVQIISIEDVPPGTARR